MIYNKKQENKLVRSFSLLYFFRKIKWIKHKIPVISCAVFFILSIIPINSYILTQKPPLFFLPFFYWLTSTKSVNIGLIYVLIISFTYDILDNSIFGLNMFLIIVMYYFLMYQKLISINKNYITHYITFIIIMLFYYFFKYMIYSYMFDVSPNIGSVIINYFTITALYPIVYIAMKKINKYISR